MPLARASCSTATPASRGIRSYVRHEPSAKTETSGPEAPRGRWGRALMARVLSGPHRDEGGVAGQLDELGQRSEGVAGRAAERAAEDRHGGEREQRGDAERDGPRGRAPRDERD